MGQISGTGELSLEQIYEKIKDPQNDVSTTIMYSHPQKTGNKSVKMSLGRVWFNTILPDDFQLIDSPVNKKKLDNIIYEIGQKYPPDRAAKIISDMQREAFVMATINPRSLSIEGLLPSEEWKDRREQFYNKAESLNDNDFIAESDKLTDELMQEMDDKNIPIQDSINAGITGKTSKATWKMLQVTKGHSVDIEKNINRIIPGTAVGYSIEDYYKAGAEGRSNYYIRSTAVSEPGYLARKVTMAASNIRIGADDCKTTKYLELFVDKNKASTLVGRYYMVDGKLQIIDNPEQIINKKILLRSPLFCKDTVNHVCKICYGKLADQAHTKNIGILAGGAVNSEALNAMMKQRHMASQVNIIHVDFIKLLKNSTVDFKLASLLLNIEPTKITAKSDINIIIDSNEYKEQEIVDYGDKFDIPGILEVSTDQGDQITLPFVFNVDLYKPDIIENDRSNIILKYSPGEVIMVKTHYVKQPNPALISKLLDGITKYILDPAVFLDVLSKELSKMDSVHLELVIANMFRSIDDLTIPGRLVNYKNCRVVGCKHLPFIDSWLSGLAFENTNKAIRVGLVENKDSSFSPIEQVLLEKVDEDM